MHRSNSMSKILSITHTCYYKHNTQSNSDNDWIDEHWVSNSSCVDAMDLDDPLTSDSSYDADHSIDGGDEYIHANGIFRDGCSREVCEYESPNLLGGHPMDEEDDDVEYLQSSKLDNGAIAVSKFGNHEFNIVLPIHNRTDSTRIAF